MNDHGDPEEPLLSLLEIFMKLEHLPVWVPVRQVAIRGTVPWPSREPYGTAIPGLFELIERNDGEGLAARLEEGGRPDLAQEVRLMLKGYEQVLLPVVPEPLLPPSA